MRRTLAGYIGLFYAITLCAGISWGENKQIASLQEEIDSLEKRQDQLELEKRALISESDTLAGRIENLKKEEDRDIGIIDEYRLKRDLRRSQELTERIETLDADIEAANMVIAEKKRVLKQVCDAEISLILEKLVASSKEETEHLLGRLRELRTIKEGLELTEEPAWVEDLRAEEIAIEEGDNSERIKEKADLISDFVDKLQGRLRLIDQRIKELEKEKRSEEKIREFVRELSIFDEDMLATRRLEGAEPFELEESAQQVPVAQQVPGRSAADRSAAGWVISTDEIEREIGELRKESGRLTRKSSDLSRKAEEFYRKADELSKSKGTTGEP